MAGNHRSGGGMADTSVRFLDAIELAEVRRLAAEEATPLVKKQCTCTGTITIDGVVYTGVRSPSCKDHGLRTRWPESISLSSAESGRSAGQIHDPRKTA